MFSRKSLEGKLNFFPQFCCVPTIKHSAKHYDIRQNLGLPCAPFRPTARIRVCRVPNFRRVFFSAGSRQTASYAVCNFFAVRFAEWHTAKISFAVCLSFVVCCFGLHTANSAFDVCPRLSPRQNSGHTNSGHTANAQFPVVYEHV